MPGTRPGMTGGKAVRSNRSRMWPLFRSVVVVAVLGASAASAQGLTCDGSQKQMLEVDLLFGDGISLAFWLNGTESGNCCAFRGGPFLESRYFGEGVGIAVRRGNDPLRQGFNWALFRLWEKGRFSDLWLRYFPISPF